MPTIIDAGVGVGSTLPNDKPTARKALAVATTAGVVHVLQRYDAEGFDLQTEESHFGLYSLRKAGRRKITIRPRFFETDCVDLTYNLMFH